MLRKRCFYLLFLFFMCGPAGAFAQGILSGKVRDASTGEPLQGAVVFITGTSKGIETGADGGFRLEGLPSGTCSVTVQLMTYATATVENIRIANNETTTLVIELAEAAEQMEEVVVRAVRRINNDIGVIQAIRNSAQVASGISGQSISRTQDSDAGEVMKRIPGISVIDDKFVIARGLSQRYNNVWINNAAVPSSEADSRAFSFDMIPAGQIESILVLKSPAPEVPADFTGGFIKISTKSILSETPFTLQYSVGMNTSAHFKDFLYNKGGATDWLGFDSGKRRIPGGMDAPFDNSSAGFVHKMTRNGFNNDWTVRTRKAAPDQKFSFSFGKNLSRRTDRQLTLNGALNYSYASRIYAGMENSRYGIYNKAEDKPEYLYNYTDDQYRTQVKAGILLNLAYTKDSSSYYFRNIFNQIGQDRLTLRKGWQNISSLYRQEKTEYSYSSRSTYNGQIAGKHILCKGDLDWEAGYSFAGKNQPDRRIVNRQENDLSGDAYYGQMGIDQNEILRDFIKLREHIASAGLNYAYTWGKNRSFKPELKTGAYSEYRTRHYRNRAFYYRYDPANLPDGFPYGEVINEILRPENYGADKLYIYDDTDNRDSYKGNSFLGAVYAAAELPLGRWNIYAGARFEYFSMALTSYTRSKGWNTRKTVYDYPDVFPSVNISYRIDDRHLLRIAYGMSVNRPEFREVSSSVYYDFDLFSDVKGNPSLTPAYIQNADMRYEWYPSNGESVSLAVFYKNFSDPIETTFLDAGGSYTYTFENGKRARVYGIELDVKKNLDFMGLRNFSLVLNGSLIQSKVRFSENSLEHDRPMQGQSPYIVNTGLFYQPASPGLTAGILYHRIGKRIVGIGRTDMSVGGSIDNDIPDMYEMPRNALDIVLGKTVGKHWELKFSARDLLAEDVKFAQFPKYTGPDGQLQSRTQIAKRFNPGRNFILNVTVKF